MAVEIIWEESGLWFRGFGVITLEEIMEANMPLIADPRFDAIRYQILDFSSITGSDISDEDAEVLGVFDTVSSKHNPNQRVAIILSPNVDSSPLAAYMDALEGCLWEVDIFPDEASAREWCLKG